VGIILSKISSLGRLRYSFFPNANEMSEIRQKTVSDAELAHEWEEIQQAKKDPKSFKALYDKYFGAVFRFVIKRTADENLTSELCSLVFYKALSQLNFYQYRGVPFSSWLFRIALNEIGQYYRLTNKNRVVSLDDTNLNSIGQETELNYEERYRPALLESLDELNENDLVVIEMRFFEQRPFKEIAEILNITEGNAKMKTYRILEKLKQKLLTKVGPLEF
jgi:RNA polymerase sigma-70 factor (ECF subfamily)